MGKTRVRAEINITPLIDVMLVLLVIFMLLSPGATRLLGAGLPGRSGGGDPPPPLAVTVEPEVFRLAETPMAELRALEAALREALALRRDRTVVVKVSGEVPYARVVSALDAARGAGADRLGLASDEGTAMQTRGPR